MSVLDQLNQRAPRAAKLMDLARVHGPIFAEAAARYLQHVSGEPAGPDYPVGARLYALASKLMLREEAAVGALVRAQQVNNPDEAAPYLRRAEKNAQFALVLASAMRKVPASDAAAADIDVDIPTFTARVIENLLSSFGQSEPVLRLWTALSAAEGRGWAVLSSDAALPIVNGANWCPDTASVTEIGNILSIPLAIMFFDYLQPPEDKGRRKHGIFRVQDHAQAAYEDGFEKPSIPVIRYPNGTTHFEPPLYQFVEQLTENGLV